MTAKPQPVALQVMAVGPENRRWLPRLRAWCQTPIDVATVNDFGELDSRLAETADVLIAGSLPTGAGRAFPRLRLLQLTGAGLDGVDLESLPVSATAANVYEHGD